MLACISLHAQIPQLHISKRFVDTCTINFSKPDSGQFFRTYPRNFIIDTASGKIDEAYMDTLAFILDQLPNCVIEIGSHTDSKGPDKKNITLSQKRAASFATYFVRICGFNKNQIRAKGFGEQQLLNG